MIELKINGHEASVVVEQGDNFLTECTMAVHVLAGAISEAEGVSQSTALKSLLLVANATEDIFDVNRNRTVVRMPKVSE
ncbi:MAG: hypothetical protein K6A75_05665 [Ruminococcus sp.]|nr:hypothetical protein [Ruminococcus sp.]